MSSSAPNESTERAEPKEVTDSEFPTRKQSIVNDVKGPDPEKAKEVEAMEKTYTETFPLLKDRFLTGKATKDPLEIIRLVQEVKRIMLLPIRPYAGKPAMVIPGITGAGKSTFSNWLLGHTLEKVSDEDDDEDDDGVSIQIADPTFSVGHTKHSKTFVPNVKEMQDGTPVIDFPGFMDTGGIEVRIGMDLAFRSMIEMLKPAHVLTLVPIDTFDAGRGTFLKQQISKLTRLLPSCGAKLDAKSAEASPEEACEWMVGITKCDRDFVKRANARFKDAIKVLQDIDAQFSDQTVININEWIFAPKVPSPQEHLKNLVFRKTKTPEKVNAMLEENVKKCFPSESDIRELSGKECVVRPWFSACPSLLISDCLSPNDIDWFQKAFQTVEFYDMFLRADATAVQSLEMNTANDDVWESVKLKVKKSHEALENYTKQIQLDSQNLTQYRLLSVERRCPEVHDLCAQRQCRLKACYVTVEERIMAASMMHIQEVQNNFLTEYQRLKENGMIRIEHCEAVEKMIEKVEAKFLEGVKELGYSDAPTFFQISSGSMGLLACAGGIGMLVHVSLTSTSLGALLTGSGSWAALSAGASTGLATGGVGLGVAFAFGLVWWAASAYRAAGNQHSKEIQEAFVKSMEDILAAHNAAKEHLKKLTAIRTSLDDLLVNPKD